MCSRSTASWAKALMHELVHKNSDEFKADAISRQIIVPFAAAGRQTSKKLLVAGFGNRPTDGKAYEMAGLTRDMIFIINSSSKISRYSSISHNQISHNACDEALEGVTNGICESDTFNHTKHNHLQAKPITEKGHKNKHFQSYDDPLLLPVIQQHI